MAGGFWTKVRNSLSAFGGREASWEVQDWSEKGGLENTVRGEPRAGYEVPGLVIEQGEEMGRHQGVVRADEETALAEENGAYGCIDGAVTVRKAVRGQAVWRKVAPAHARSKSAPRRAEREVARTGHLRELLGYLRDEALPAAETALGTARDELAKARQGLMEKPRLLRGYFSTRGPVAAAAAAVVVFDAFVLHGALETSGLDVVTVWGTTATVAAAIAAANHGFGVLAGAIGLATPARHRLRVAAVLFAAGFGAMLLAFLLLMLFRAEATDATNAALESIAKGKVPDRFTFFISPLWMGPLQVGGSLAAISLTAFWTMAKEGREYTAEVIVPAERIVAEAAGRVSSLQGQIAATEQRLETAIVAKHEIEADGVAAGAEVEAALIANHAADEGEDGLATAAKGRYRAAYAYHEKLYRNAGLYRMATPSVLSWFRRRWRSRGEADRPARPWGGEGGRADTFQQPGYWQQGSPPEGGRGPVGGNGHLRPEGGER